MHPREITFARFVKSRFMATILACVAFVEIILAGRYGHPWLLTANRGIALPSPNLWFAVEPVLSTAVNLLCLLATAGLMLRINVRYGILRSYSTTFAGLFLLMTAALPSTGAFFQGGAMLSMLVMLAAYTMMSTYQQPRDTPGVFYSFLIITIGALTQYGFVVFLPVMLLGCAQMRTLSPRVLVAALLGVVTPIWLWWALGTGDLRDSIHLPRMVNIFTTMSRADIIQLVSVTGFTLVASILCAGVNLFRIFSFNARSRAFNGLLLALSGVTWLMLFVDYTNLPFYLPLLNALTAFQIGHFFALNYQRRGYIIILFFSLAYFGAYIWCML